MFPLGAQQLFRYIFWHEDQENSNRLPYIGQKILTCKITYSHVWNQPVRKKTHLHETSRRDQNGTPSEGIGISKGFTCSGFTNKLAS